MLAKLKSNTNTLLSEGANVFIDSNPIANYYEIGKLSGTAGPELSWKLYEAHAKSNQKEATIFYFDKRTAEKLYKVRRKEVAVDVLKRGFYQLKKFQHYCQVLQIYHNLEETNDTLAFATEPVFGSLANIFGYLQDRLRQDIPSSLREYSFLEFEVKYGLLQITEGLFHLHYSSNVIHHNICPQSVIINKKGTWKLFGFEFIINCPSADIMCTAPCLSFTSKLPKLTQPDLNYFSPESQLSSICSPQSDMFSFGLLITSLYNNGRSLLESNLNVVQYTKQLEQINRNLNEVLNNLPSSFQAKEHVEALLDIDPQRRPNSQAFSMIKYFFDPGINALQYLDIIHTKDQGHKANFYHSLRGILSNIPKKIWFQHILPTIADELKDNEVASSVLEPILFMLEESNTEECQTIIFPQIKELFFNPKSAQATIVLCENINIFLKKAIKQDIKDSILPMILDCFESKNVQIQPYTLSAACQILDTLDEAKIQTAILEKIKSLIYSDLDCSIQANGLRCLEKIIDKLNKSSALDYILPILRQVHLVDPEIAVLVTRIYKHMLDDKRFGLTTSTLATVIMPSIIPILVSLELDMTEFAFISEFLQDVLDQITKNQRNRIKSDKRADSISKGEKLAIEINFNQPTNPLYPKRPPALNLESRRKSLSQEDLNSLNSPSPDNNNFLTVASAVRRHSDNAINIPKIKIALSSPTGSESRTISRASSSVNIATRKYSGLNPKEIKQLTQRRYSSINLHDLNNINRRRHSSINTNELKRVVNKISHAADDMLMSAAESIESKASQLKVDFNPVPILTSPSRGRRSSIAALFGQNQTPSLFGSSSSKSSNKLLGKLGNKKAKSPTSSSEKILNQFGSEVQHLLGK